MELTPGYKNTEIGVIPEDWAVVRLDDIFAISAGGDVDPERTSQEQDGTYAFPIYSNAIANGGLYGFASYAHHPRNSLTVTARGTLGHAVYRDHEFTAIGRVLVLVPSGWVDPAFMASFINDRVSFAVESTGVPQLTAPQIGRYLVALPPLTEQRAIVAALADVDGAIAGLTRLITKKRDIKQAAMQQLLTGRTRLPGFSGDWKVLSLAEKSDLHARIGWQGLTTAEYRASGSILLVTGTDFQAGAVSWETCWYVSEERYQQDQKIQLKVNDILLTKDGTIGKVGFIDKLPLPATLNSGVFVIRPKHQAYVPRFFYYVLNSFIFRGFLNKLQAGSTILHLYQKDFVKFEFSVPSTLQEQSAIAAVLSDIDSELTALEARLEKTRALKQAMMQALLTGRVRLPVSSNQESANSEPAYA